MFKKCKCVSDMDPILQEVASKFNMKIFWDHRHVNQSIVRKLKGETCLNVVLHFMKLIRNSPSLQEAKKITTELKTTLLTKEKSLENSINMKNPNFNKKAWKYLNKQYFASDEHYNKLCRWTVQHLDVSFWSWSQAVESRHNKDLNIWNSGTTKLSLSECILRYQQIDKAELRILYLHFLQAQLPQLKKAIIAQKSNKESKFVKSVVAENVNMTIEETQPLIMSPTQRIA